MVSDKDLREYASELPTLDFEEHEESLHFLEEAFLQTETLQVDSFFTSDVTVTGSFDIRGIQKTSLGKLLDSLPTPALILDRNQLIFFANQSLNRIVDEPSSLQSAPFSEGLVWAKDAETAKSALEKVLNDRTPQVVEGLIGSRKNPIWGRMHMRSLRMWNERFILVLIEDLTAERKRALLAKKYAESLKESRDGLELRVQERTLELVQANEVLKREIAVRRCAEESLALAAKVIANSNEAILITDAKGIVMDVNRAFHEMTGYSGEEVVGKNPRFMRSGHHAKAFWNEFWRTLSRTGHWRGEVWNRRKDGEVFPSLLSVSALKGTEGGVTHYVGMYSDISRIKQSEERLDRLAHYDPLTGLPNRLLFSDRLNWSLIGARRRETAVALMFLDLDDFKRTNDTLGHPKGDELLIGVAERLSDCVRAIDTVARFGGDEFTIIMPDITEIRHVAAVAQRVTESLSRPFVVGGDEVFTSVSTGISMYPQDAEDADKMLQHADTAMYHAKARGQGNFQFFSREMNAEITRLVAMELTLRRAKENNGFLIYYQPVVDCRTGQVTGMEALLRVKDSTREFVSAAPYISVAEEKGLIVAIGEWVLRNSCKQTHAWETTHGEPLVLSVNLSMRQLQDPSLFERFQRLIAETRHDCARLELELTESAIMANSQLAMGVLARFREMGVSVIIDDFGTGYSSLSRLKDLPVDKIKIDRSFVKGITHDTRQQVLIQAIVQVAHSLEMKVVVEGVESEQQWVTLRDLGCDLLQGFYFSPPVPSHEFEKLIGRRLCYS